MPQRKSWHPAYLTAARTAPCVCPIHDCHQIQKAVLHGDVGNVAAPDMVRARDRQLSQQVWPDLVLGMLLAGVGPFVDGLQPHDAHQATHTMATRGNPDWGR